ncbi:MAG TPA: prepilin-type N-terminal cleavage/methylation domain-containing protein [bacterium]|nr:prepilin-type N-terminal cleavage/methylation domain-containing protein [bacterium]
MTRTHKILRGAQGFTLVEIAIVVAIIGILLLIALPMFSGARARAYVAEARQLSSEWKALTWACLIEKNFDQSKCTTPAMVGWVPAQASAAWNWPTAYMFCGNIASIPATQAQSSCAAPITGVTAVVGLVVPLTATPPAGLTFNYLLAIKTTTGQLLESPSNGTAMTP